MGKAICKATFLQSTERPDRNALAFVEVVAVSAVQRAPPCRIANRCNRAELHGQMGEEKERLTGGSRRRDWVGASARLSTAGKRTSRGGRCPKHAQDSTTLEAAAS